MQHTDRKKIILIIAITLFTLILSAIAIATAWKLRQLATVPVTPNAPQSQPQAASVPTATPTPQLVCAVSFEVENSSCDGWCNDNSDCETGMTCLITGTNDVGVCRNPSCTSDVDCLCPGATPTPTPTSTPGATPTPAPTATPTPTNVPDTTPTTGPTSAITATPRPTNPPATLVACNGSCSSDEDCSGTNVCQSGMCRNPSCSSETDCTCAASVAPTAPTLPQAGSDMPTIVLLSMGTIILITGLIGLLVL